MASAEARLGVDQPFFADGGRLFESAESGYVRPGQELRRGQTRLVTVVNSQGERVVCEEWIAEPGEVEARQAMQHSVAPPVNDRMPPIEHGYKPAAIEHLELVDDSEDDDSLFGLKTRPAKSSRRETEEAKAIKPEKKTKHQRRMRRSMGSLAMIGAIGYGMYFTITGMDNSPVEFAHDISDFGNGAKESYELIKGVVEFVS